MTTKTIKCNNTKCRRVWNYQGSKRKGAKTRCPDCTRTVTIPLLIMLALIPLASVAMAEQQVLVTLPVDRPYAYDSCGLMTSVDGVLFSCVWRWNVDPDTVISFDPMPVNNQTAYEIWLTEVLPLIEANPHVEPEAPDEVIVGAEEGDEPPTTSKSLEDLDPEVRRALDKLGECQFGEGVWAGIVANYTREVPEELPIFTSGLDKRRILGELARHFEECRGMTDYPWLSEAYVNRYLADSLGLDLYGRTIDTRGNQASLMFAQTAGVTDEDKAKEADKWRDWACKDSNLHLKLCNAYQPLTGENRGGYTDGSNCQELGQPASEDGSSARERCPMQEFVAFMSADPTSGDIHERIQQTICDEYETKYEYLAIDKRPGWLSHCYNE